MHPMKAIFEIPAKEPPLLPDPENFSPAFVDFIAQCLAFDPEQRSSAAELLTTHPFVQVCEMTSSLTDLMTTTLPAVLRFRQVRDETTSVMNTIHASLLVSDNDSDESDETASDSEFDLTSKTRGTNSTDSKTGSNSTGGTSCGTLGSGVELNGTFDFGTFNLDDL
jgi:serine/threonine protein kinase